MLNCVRNLSPIIGMRGLNEYNVLLLPFSALRSTDSTCGENFYSINRSYVVRRLLEALLPRGLGNKLAIR